MREVTVSGATVTVRGSSAAPEEVIAHMTSRELTYRDLRITGPTLDDAYVTLSQEARPR